MVIFLVILQMSKIVIIITLSLLPPCKGTVQKIMASWDLFNGKPKKHTFLIILLMIRNIIIDTESNMWWFGMKGLVSKGAFFWDQSGIRLIQIIRVSIFLGANYHFGIPGFPFRLFCSQEQNSRNISRNKFQNILLFRNIPNEHALKKVVVLCRWGHKAWKFGIKPVDKGKITSVRRSYSTCAECSCFMSP